MIGNKFSVEISMALTLAEYITFYVCLGLLAFFAIRFYMKGKAFDDTLATTRQMFFGFALMFTLILISRIIDNPIREIVNPENNLKSNATWYEWMNAHLRFGYEVEMFKVGNTIIFNWVIVNLLFLLGLAVATYFMEKNFIPKSMHIFSIFIAFLAVSSLVLAFMPLGHVDVFDTSRTDVWWGIMYTYLGYLAFLIISIIYWIMAKRSTGDIRRKANQMAFGFLMILADVHTIGHNSGGWVRLILALVGFLLLYLGMRQPKID